METTVKERIIRYIKYKQISRREFEKTINVSNGYINNLKSQPRDQVIEKIILQYPDLNRVWLLTGEGEMLNMVNEVEPYYADRHIGIPLVSQYAYGGYLTGFADPEYIDQLPTLDFTPNFGESGNYVAFEIRGDSMNDGTIDSYPQGDIVICREVEPHLWQNSKLHFNHRDFVIVHKKGILIKRVIAHDVDTHVITIHSLNPEYEDETINLADVRQIFSIHEQRRTRKR